eukprot:2623970-Pyramimonas_sp.AAC.1
MVPKSCCAMDVMSSDNAFVLFSASSVSCSAASRCSSRPKSAWQLDPSFCRLPPMMSSRVIPTFSTTGGGVNGLTWACISETAAA